MGLRMGLGLLIGGSMLAGSARTEPPHFVARLKALALLETLNADLLSHDSATETLQRWCDVHSTTPGARIAARRAPGADKSADESVRRDLAARPGEAVRYRHVQLVCGDRVLSDADNWYLPARLTPEMNRALEETERPFGLVVKPLNFHRRTLAARLLFQPLPEGWETRPQAADDGPMVLPAHVLEHRALLSTPNGTPFSLVVESYTDQVLR